jgi:hypothetical protein
LLTLSRPNFEFVRIGESGEKQKTMMRDMGKNRKK